MSASADEALVKGAMIREFLLWYEARFGRDYAEEALRRTPAKLRERLFADRMALGFVANGWYPSPVLFAVLDAIASRHEEAELSRIIRESDEAIVRRMTKGVYEFLFKMVASPGLYARHIQRAWRLLHTTGTREMTIVSPGVADSVIRDWPGHHRWLCEVVHETMRCVFVAMGCQNVELERTACVSRGDRECRARVRFREP